MSTRMNVSFAGVLSMTALFTTHPTSAEAVSPTQRTSIPASAFAWTRPDPEQVSDATGKETGDTDESESRCLSMPYWVEAIAAPRRLHADRASDCRGDHRGLGGIAVALAAEGKGICQSRQMSRQSASALCLFSNVQRRL